jgi:pimeloyl-ACP methyl ester carboxylesterase
LIRKPTVVVAWLLAMGMVQPPLYAGASRIDFEPYSIATSTGDTIHAELGRLLVPENRAARTSRSVELALVRLRSTGNAPGPPLVFLAGGPGNSGIDALNGPRLPLFLALREYGDVIALDQRGTGRSRPSLDCSERLDLPLDRPTTHDALLRQTLSLSRACASRLRSEGVDLSGYNVRESADDLEDLRHALGSEKICLLGLSYGTTLGLEAIRRHGDRIHRGVLAGVEGTDDMLKLPARLDPMFGSFDSLARTDSTVFAQWGPPLATVTSILRDAEARPVWVRWSDGMPDSVVVLGAYDLRWFFWKVMASDGLVFLPALTHAMGGGDFRMAAAFVATHLKREAIDGAMTACTDCASGASRARLRAVEAETPRALLANVPNFVYPDVCAAWGVPDLGSAFRESVRSDVPVLFISGTLDARTPPEQAEAVRRGLPNSGHLILEGAVHGDPLLLSSPRIRDVMLAFLRTGKAADERVQVPLRFLPLTALELPTRP